MVEQKIQKFELLIMAAGLNPKDYPSLANIPVEIFDRKDRKMSEATKDLLEENLLFVNFLFKKNLNSKKEFKKLLEEENNKISPSNTIQARLTDNIFVVYMPNGRSHFFWLQKENY